MSRGTVGGRIQVPDELREVLLEFTISYLLEQPGDVIGYAADYFTRLRDARVTSILFDGAPPEEAQSPDDSTISREEGMYSMDISYTYYCLTSHLILKLTKHTF